MYRYMIVYVLYTFLHVSARPLYILYVGDVGWIKIKPCVKLPVNGNARADDSETTPEKYLSLSRFGKHEPPFCKKTGDTIYF